MIVDSSEGTLDSRLSPERTHHMVSRLHSRPHFQRQCRRVSVQTVCRLTLSPGGPPEGAAAGWGLTDCVKTSGGASGSPQVVKGEVEEEGSVPTVHEAAATGDLEELNRLLDVNDSLGNSKDDRSKTALHWASEYGNAEIVRTLIDHGVDVNLTDDQGCTALVSACLWNFRDVAMMLLECGADPSIQDKHGSNALIYAAYCAGPEVVRALLRDGRVAVNHANHKGETALWEACYCNLMDVARVLVMEGGADPSLADKQGRTPFAIAQEKGHKECVELLESVSKMKQERVKEARRARVEALAVGRRPATAPSGSANCASSKSPDLGIETVADEEEFKHESVGQALMDHRIRGGSHGSGMHGGDGRESDELCNRGSLHRDDGMMERKSGMEAGGHHQLGSPENKPDDDSGPYDRVAQWRHIQCLQRKLVAEITAYKNSAHADSATKKQLRFSKNTTRKELKDAWAFFEKHEREFMCIKDGEGAEDVARNRLGYIVYPYHPEIHADRINYLGLMLSEMETWRDGLTPDRLADLEREGELIREELGALLRTKAREDFKAAGGMLGPNPSLNSNNMMLPDVSLLLASFQSLNLDGSGSLRSNKSAQGGSNKGGVDLDGKKCSQSATSSPCQPYRSAVTIQRHHSYDRITSSTNHYAKHFPTYSPPPSYRNTLLSASSATAPPFYPEPGPSTYHYGGTRPNQFRMPSAQGGASSLSGTGGLYPAQSQSQGYYHNGGGRLPASSTLNQHSALQRISRGGMGLLRLSATADSPSGLASTDLVGPWTRLRRDEKEEAGAPQQHWLFR